MHNKRAHRVAQLLKQELSALTVRGLRDPRVGLVTVTDVRLTDDLRAAQVFISVLGDDETRKATLAGLTAAAGYLRHEITHSLQLRFAPTLYFRYDDSLVRAQRLDALLGAAARGEPEPKEADLAVDMPPAETGREQRTLATPPPPAAAAKAAKKRPANKRTVRRSASGRTPRAHKAGRSR